MHILYYQAGRHFNDSFSRWVFHSICSDGLAYKNDWRSADSNRPLFCLPLEGLSENIKTRAPAKDVTNALAPPYG